MSLSALQIYYYPGHWIQCLPAHNVCTKDLVSGFVSKCFKLPCWNVFFRKANYHPLYEREIILFSFILFVNWECSSIQKRQRYQQIAWNSNFWSLLFECVFSFLKMQIMSVVLFSISSMHRCLELSSTIFSIDEKFWLNFINSLSFHVWIIYSLIDLPVYLCWL